MVNDEARVLLDGAEETGGISRSRSRGKTWKTSGGAYRWPGAKSRPARRRIILTASSWARLGVLKVLRFLGETLDYSNFKDTVADTPDQEEKHNLSRPVLGNRPSVPQWLRRKPSG